MKSDSISSLRSMLFVPTLQEKFIAGADRAGADAIILDLEDSIAPSEKDRARDCLVKASTFLAKKGLRVFVRINSSPDAQMKQDVVATAHRSIEGLLIPKVESAEQVHVVAKLSSESRERESAPKKLIPLIESPRGILNLKGISEAHQDVVGLAFGSEDYAVSMDVAPEEVSMLFPAQQMVVAARAAGIAALGLPGSIANVTNMEHFQDTVELARRIGMTGVLCVHPKQVSRANAAFSPSEEDLQDAKDIKRIYEEALAKGTGATTFKGKMIDIPHYQRALSVLSRAVTAD